MSTSVLARGVSAANSSNVVLAASTDSALLFLATDEANGSVPDGVRVDVQLLQSNGTSWTTLAQLSPTNGIVIVPGPCTFRVKRPAIPVSWGVQIGVDRG